MKSARGLLAAFVCTMALPIPASAAAGCELYATGQHPGNCRYVADGPGTYEVKTLSGFRIMASSDGGASWTTLAAKIGTPEQPFTAMANESGPLATTAGQLVDVAISIAEYTPPGQPKLRYQDGYIRGGS